MLESVRWKRIVSIRDGAKLSRLVHRRAHFVMGNYRLPRRPTRPIFYEPKGV
jgi:hypothetical protein